MEIEAEPSDVGLDATRLRRIETHFKQYVDDGRIPGWVAAVSRRGKLVYCAAQGVRDLDQGDPVTADTIFRIYSMTKPVTAVAAMILYEQGAFELTDPVSRFLPSFGDQRIFLSGEGELDTAPASEPMRIWHLLTHTSGLAYANNPAHPVDALYRKSGLTGASGELDLGTFSERLGEMPLLFSPGTKWHYSFASDVLGRIVELISGMPLDQFFAERIFEPLGMSDTGFWTPESKLGRLATLYASGAEGVGALKRRRGGLALQQPTFLSGGAGLVSSLVDFRRFSEMLLGEGVLGGTRVLGSRTVQFMTQNHLPGAVDLEEIGQTSFTTSRFSGVGFGFGLSVVTEPVRQEVLSSAGEFGWPGAAGTAFWVDPKEEMTVLLFAQVMSPSASQLKNQLKQLVHQAIVD